MMNQNLNIDLDGFSQKDLDELASKIKNTKINVLMIGGTGVGKSSTIDALLKEKNQESDVVIGTGTDPETMEVGKYTIDSLTIWDTPGLGDGIKDKEHKEKIKKLLLEVDEEGSSLIDLVFIVLDAGSRDYSSAFELIENTVMPNINPEDKERILIGINQADMALKGRFWSENGPEPELHKRLEDLSESVKLRMHETTGLSVDPICYSAGYSYEGKVQTKPYNLQKLLSFILDKLPSKKRAAFIQYTDNKNNNFENNDSREDYTKKINDTVYDSLLDSLKDIVSGLGEGVKKLLSDPEVIKATLGFVLTRILTKKP